MDESTILLMRIFTLHSPTYNPKNKQQPNAKNQKFSLLLSMEQRKNLRKSNPEYRQSEDQKQLPRANLLNQQSAFQDQQNMQDGLLIPYHQQLKELPLLLVKELPL